MKGYELPQYPQGENVVSHINRKTTMTNIERFSKRQNLYTLNEKEIIIREDAPEGLRGYIKMAYYDLSKTRSLGYA